MTSEKRIDEVLDKFGIFQSYHLQFLLFTILAFSCTVIFSQNYIFVAEEVKYRCTDKAFSNDTCGVVNGTHCTEWIYDNPHSFVAEFQIACQEWKRTLVGTANVFGYMVGLLIIGPLSDRIGRKNTFIWTGVLSAIIGVAKSFSHSYWLYIALEVLGSVADNYSPLYVLSIEIISAKKRVIYHFLCTLGTPIAGILFPLMAWGVPYWRHLLQVMYAPAFFFLVYFFLIDESPRWLLSKGKKDEAIAILEKMACKSKVEISKDKYQKVLKVDENDDIGFMNLLKMTLKSTDLLKRCLVCIVWWTTCTFVYQGMMIHTVSLQGDKHLNYGLTQLFHLPGRFIIMFIVHYYDRKFPLISSFFASALLCFVQPFLPAGLPWLSVVVYVASSLMSSFFFGITYIYTAELFPTYTRNSMHAICSAIGRIGGLVAPQIPLLAAYSSNLPMIVFGCTSLIAGFVTFLVPDTANIALPDNVQEAENIGKKKPPVTGLDNLGMTQELYD